MTPSFLSAILHAIYNFLFPGDLVLSMRFWSVDLDYQSLINWSGELTLPYLQGRTYICMCTLRQKMCFVFLFWNFQFCPFSHFRGLWYSLLLNKPLTCLVIQKADLFIPQPQFSENNTCSWLVQWSWLTPYGYLNIVGIKITHLVKILLD